MTLSYCTVDWAAVENACTWEIKRDEMSRNKMIEIPNDIHRIHRCLRRMYKRKEHMTKGVAKNSTKNRSICAFIRYWRRRRRRHRWDVATAVSLQMLMIPFCCTVVQYIVVDIYRRFKHGLIECIFTRKYFSLWIVSNGQIKW